MSLRPSRFALVLPDQTREGWLIFNTLTREALVLDGRVAQAAFSELSQVSTDWGRVLRGGPGGQARRSLLGAGRPTPTEAASLEQGFYAALASRGLLVGDNEDVEKAYDFLRGYWDSPTLALTLAVTADCQLDCGYCFQKGRELGRRHSARTQADLLEFVEGYLDQNSQLSGLFLGLFGGEPLTAPDLAESYLESLQTLALERGLSWEVSLTTNGLEMDVPSLLKWHGAGLKYIRVCLDGPPEIHDRRRPHRKGGETFERILANLVGLCHQAPSTLGLGVSLNLDRDNESAVERLLDLLLEHGLREEVEILFEPTLPTPHWNVPLDSYRERGGRTARVLQQAASRGFAVSLNPGHCVPCNLVHNHSFIVDWSGRLFGCSFSMMEPGLDMGDLRGGLNERHQELRASRNVAEHCLRLGCPYLPLCGGGCRWETRLRKGRFDAFDCPVDYWDQVLPVSVPANLAMSGAGREASTDPRLQSE